MHIGFRQLQIPPEIRTGVVKAIFICAAHEVTHYGCGSVGQYSYTATNRTDVTGTTAHVMVDLIICCKAEIAKYLVGFDFIQLVIATQ
jgi:hypothetical protein